MTVFYTSAFQFLQEISDCAVCTSQYLNGQYCLY